MTYNFDSLLFTPCVHDEPHRVRQKVCIDGRVRYYLQCERCGSMQHQHVTNQLAIELLNGNEADEEDRNIRERYWLERVQHRERAKAKWRAMYDSYMRSEQWAQKRRAVIARDGICAACRDAPISEIHHLTYERIGRELLEDLVGICSPCHAVQHGRFDIIKVDTDAPIELDF